MAKLPRKILYNHQPVSVRRGKTGKNWAYFEGAERVIVVDTERKMSPEFKAELILHELLHCIIYEHFGLSSAFAGKNEKQNEESEECIVDTLARDLVQVLKRNPAMLKFLNQSLLQ
jgi:hypothetical protein